MCANLQHMLIFTLDTDLDRIHSDEGMKDGTRAVIFIVKRKARGFPSTIIDVPCTMQFGRRSAISFAS